MQLFGASLKKNVNSAKTWRTKAKQKSILVNNCTKISLDTFEIVETFKIQKGK